MTILNHYNDVIMSVMTSQITSLTIVYSNVCSGANQRKHQRPGPVAFVRVIHRPPHRRLITRKMSNAVYWEDCVNHGLVWCHLCVVAVRTNLTLCEMWPPQLRITRTQGLIIICTFWIKLCSQGWRWIRHSYKHVSRRGSYASMDAYYTASYDTIYRNSCWVKGCKLVRLDAFEVDCRPTVCLIHVAIKPEHVNSPV